MHSTIQPRGPRQRLVTPGGIEHHVADMTATFCADLTLRDVQARLRENNQWLAVDGEPDAPMGSLVEANSTGPLRLGFGAWRDNLLGVQFLNGSTELITAGGRVLKNVAGYDLTRFMVGQFGCFGKIVTITSRTYRLPTHAMLAAFEPRIEMLSKMIVTNCRPQWCVLTNGALLMGYLGDEAAISFYQHTIKRFEPSDVIVHGLENDTAARGKLWNVPGEHFRAMIPPARLGEFIDRAQLRDFAADAAFGIVKSSETGSRGQIESVVMELKGNVIFFDATGKPRDLKIDPAAAKLLGTLKNAFDPNNTLGDLSL